MTDEIRTKLSDMIFCCTLKILERVKCDCGIFGILRDRKGTNTVMYKSGSGFANGDSRIDMLTDVWKIMVDNPKAVDDFIESMKKS